MDFHLDKICRICLKEGEDLKSIFYSEEIAKNEVSLQNKIMACSSVQVVPGDGLPQFICTKCLAQVDVAYDFKEKCQSADATLRRYITLLSSSMLNVESNVKDVEEISQKTCGGNAEADEEDNMNVFEFEKNDSSSIIEEDEKMEGSNESDSDNPLILQLNQYKKKRKMENKTKKTKADTNKKCSEDVINATDCDKKKRLKDDKDVKCPICKKTFAYLCILKDHMVQHTGAKPYLCSVCGKSFGHTASLTNHMKTHYSEKPHKCDRCDLSFHRRAHLVLHTRTHTGEKPFVCDVCGRDFAQSSYLKEHMRVHSGEKPFVCDVCGHGFARKSCLVMHRRVHTGELPYACPECGRAFSQRSQRKRHVKRNHKESSCLRATGELILKDLDFKNKSAAQEEIVSENSVTAQRNSVSVAMQRHTANLITNNHFREMTIFQQDSASLNSGTMPLPLIQIHRTLL